MSENIRVILADKQVASYTDPRNAVEHAVLLVQDLGHLGEVKLQKYIVEDYLPLKGKTFWFDYGHGGTDSGAHDGEESIYGDYINSYEKYLNLAIGLLIAKKARLAGASVFETRTADTTHSLSDRVSRANLAKVDFFFSFHHNGFSDQSASGIEVFTYFYPHPDTLKMATCIQNSLIKATGAKDRKVQQKNLYVLRETKMHAVLVEFGFITNTAEEKLLNNPDYREKMAQAVLDGIVAGLTV